MNERELRAALRRAAPDDDASRERAWSVVRAEYVQRGPETRRRHRARAAVPAALAIVAAAAGVAVAAPRSEVGGWLRRLVGVAEQRSRPALLDVPGGGRLLVRAGSGAWVVSADGAKRRLGTYDGVSWSPHGLFVIAWRGQELTALEPQGRVRWSLAAPAVVTAARWAPVDGFRIAYLAGGQLRIVNGDGTGDRPYALARARVAPAWRRDGSHVLAYADRRGRVVVVAVDGRRRLWRTPPLDRPAQLAWSASGRRLLVITGRGLTVFDRTGRRLDGGVLDRLGAVRDAAWAPRRSEVAVVRRLPGGRRSEVLLATPGSPRARRLLTAPGRLDDVDFSPRGDRVMVGWPDADQWLFLRARGVGRPIAVANVAAQFAPGATEPRVPRAVEWCCPDAGG